MKLAAFVLMLISTIVMGCFLIPLIWCIPMTVKCYKAYKNNTKLSIGFSICTLLFVDIISGVLLLIDSAD